MLYYGLTSDADPLTVELAFIRPGGYMEVQGQKYGAGLFHHYRQMESLLWPEDDHHRWSDLILREYLSNRIIAVMGSRDSSKTRTLSKIVLCEYYAFPDETLTLMTSTNLRGLELRVWGDIKALHERAKDRYEWLPGNVADSKHGIFTDSITEGDQVRDMRRGILCFLKGSMVDTLKGPVPIENIQPGNAVINAIGSGIVRRCYSRTADELVRVVLSDGRKLLCTPEHPIMTYRGWTKAIDLTTCDRVLSAYEIMSMLREGSGSRLSQSEILFGHLPQSGYASKMQTVRRLVPTVEARVGKILQHCLCGSVGGFNGKASHGEQRGMPSLWQGVHWALQSEVLLGLVSADGQDATMRGVRENVSIHKALSNEASQKVLRAIVQSESNQPRPWKKGFASYSPGACVEVSASGRRTPSSYCDGPEICPERAALLHGGFGIPRSAVSYRTGWGDSQDTVQKESGCSANRKVGQAWVVSVEILKSSSDQGFVCGGGKYSVHNLEITGHPSYSVNGVLVHNCIPVIGAQGEYMGESLRDFCGIKQKRRRLIGDELQFIPRDYLRVLDSLDKGDFRAAFLGNPIAENGKALDAVSEPADGWDSLGPVTKTRTWPNKYNGVTINLVGTDSPNFDPETLNRYPYMVDQSDVDRVSKRPGGKDSLEWWSQIMGVRKAGAVSNRVLTVAEIESYGGFKDCIWSGQSDRIKVYSIDAGFGGDECVRTWLEFGETVEGQQVIAFGDQKVIPILLSSTLTPEKQIAQYAKLDCATLGIPAAHVFFDAGMYATLAVELAREMSPEVNAVNFGGTATERPVSNDMFTYDEQTQQRRLKTWYEHVSKFVTELWFVVRLLAQCKQARRFPRAAAEEFGRRQWRYVYNDRYELESKDDYKLRTNGESPNHADSLVIGVEGARRLGFTIENLPGDQSQPKEDDEYLIKALTEYQTGLKRRSLSYTMS